MAKGSAAELIAQAEIALGVGHLDQNHARRLTDASEEVSKMLGGLIKYREKSA